MRDLRDISVADVDGIGPKRSDALYATYRIQTVQDLLYFYPSRYADRSKHRRVSELSEGDEALVSGEITNLRIKGTDSKQRLVAVVRDGSGSKIEGVFFQGINGLRNVLKRMDRIAMFGEAQRYGRRLSMSHPEFFQLGEETNSLDVGRIVPFYPHGEMLEDSGLTQSKLREVIYGVIESLEPEEFPAYLPPSIEEEQGLMPGHKAIRAAHFPESEEEIGRAQRRIKFEELFFLQLLMARERKRRQDASPLPDQSGLEREFLDSLPFELTGDQDRALREIEEDISKPYQMNRLLQGDVGAGKTVVAVAAMLRAVDNEKQAAFLAPTSVLAEQHYKTLREYLKPLGIDPVLLKSDLSDSELSSRREKAANGAPVTVGTHALIEDDTEFKNLALAVVDEQHRFGVEQRREMFDMGTRPHKLLMTATPIPRSLAMGLYGDLDVSVIEEMPPGRKPVDTRWLPEREMNQVYDFIRGEVNQGYQAFVVYPLKEPSPDMPRMQDLQTGLQRMRRKLPSALVESVHGQSDEKDAVMKAFSEGQIDVLCATTVVEVGVDVPNATTMVVRDADFFGLSQLHQLRGRVGRSDVQSYCLLTTQGNVTDKASRRLSAMAETNDGFEIAETDLDIRGVGDFLGTRQSGMPGTHMASVKDDAKLMEETRDVATQVVEEDPSLSQYEGAQDVLARRFGGEEKELAQVA